MHLTRRGFCIAPIAASAAIAFPQTGRAEISRHHGVVSSRELPAAVFSRDLVVLPVPHMSQGRRPWCVPVSAAMVLAYFGVRVDPAALKAAAEDYKPSHLRNIEFTYWDDLQVALRGIGQDWRMQHYQVTQSGYSRGLADIKRALRRGRPVLVEVHLEQGHTFVVIGFNEAEQVVYIRDPLLRANQIRILSYGDMRRSWHNHQFSRSRSAFFARPPRT